MPKVSSLLLLALLLPGLAAAQTVDLTPMQVLGYDDGVGEVAWKLQNPTGSADWFSVDFGADLAGATIAALWADSASTGTLGSVQSIGVATSAASGFPDTSTAVMQNAVVAASDGFNSVVGYAVPCFDPGTDFHVVYQQTPGDTEAWLVADTDGALSGRSYFSSDSYVSGTQANYNLRLGAAGWNVPLDGTLLVNGGASATVTNIDQVCLTFSACQGGVVSALYLCSPVFFGPLLSPSITTTGGPLGGPCSNQWTLCTDLCCYQPGGGPFGFCCVYVDPCDTKPSGKPRVKVSTVASLTIDASVVCDTCYGQLDDGSVDFYVWKVSSVAGSGDWFNVNHGTLLPSSACLVHTITGVELSAWDLCGFGPCWAEVGAYADAGGVPDINGLKSTATNPCVPAGAADVGPYPMTYYDVPDIPHSSAATWHVAAHWPAGDTCIWMGADSDGIDASCGLPIPNAGTTSGFSASDYATGLVGFTAANWCMKLDWS